MLYGLDCSFPQAPEMGGSRRVESPADAIICQPTHDLVRLSTSLSEQLVKLQISSHEVGVAVAVDDLTQTSTGNEATEGCQEGVPSRDATLGSCNK